MLNRPAETHLLRSYSRQEWGSCERVFGQSSQRTASAPTSVSPFEVPARASGNTDQFGVALTRKQQLLGKQDGGWLRIVNDRLS